MYFSVYNLLGSKVTEGQFTGKAANIDITRLASGVYFLKIYNQNAAAYKKFVVERK